MNWAWLGPVLVLVGGLAGIALKKRLDKRSTDLDDVGQVLQNWETVWGRLNDLEVKADKARDEASAARAETRVARDEADAARAETRVALRKLNAAVEHIDHQNVQLSHLGVTPRPLPEELRS